MHTSTPICTWRDLFACSTRFVRLRMLSQVKQPIHFTFLFFQVYILPQMNTYMHVCMHASIYKCRSIQLCHLSMYKRLEVLSFSVSLCVCVFRSSVYRRIQSSISHLLKADCQIIIVYSRCLAGEHRCAPLTNKQKRRRRETEKNVSCFDKILSSTFFLPICYNNTYVKSRDYL